jgi:two-component system response regulator MtrA
MYASSQHVAIGREPGTVMHHILVVDDDPVTRTILTSLLTGEGYTVTTVASATEALEAITSRVLFDLIVLDVMLPEMDGLEVCRRIRATSVTPIIFISALQDIKDKLAGFTAGGDDYITKPFEPLEVLVRVRVAIRRAPSMLPAGEHLSTPDMKLNVVDHQVTLARSGRVVRLTPIETRLLRCLVINAGQVLTRDHLMRMVWGYGYESESNQLDVYMRRLRDKLEEQPSQPEMFLTVRGVGYAYRPGKRVTPLIERHRDAG